MNWLGALLLLLGISIPLQESNVVAEKLQVFPFEYNVANPDYPYSVPHIDAENFEHFMTKKNDQFKLVMFVATDRFQFCRACKDAVCYLNEVMWHVDRNAMGMCTELDAQEGYRDIFTYRRTRGTMHAAIIIVRDPEFLRHHQVTGVPQIRLYKPNGEMIDYRGQISTHRYFSITLRLRDFLAETCYGESIFHRCTDYLVGEYQNTTYYPGLWGIYCDHFRKPWRQFMSNGGSGANRINRANDIRYKKGMPDQAEDAY